MLSRRFGHVASPHQKTTGFDSSGPAPTRPRRWHRPWWVLTLAVAISVAAAACSDSTTNEETPASTTTPVTASTTTTLAPGEPLSFAVFDPFSADLKESLRQGDIDIALLFSTDGDIAANDWVLLEDNMGLQDKENVVPLIRRDANSAAITEALQTVSAALTTEDLTELNRRAAQSAPPDVVTGWLESEGLIPFDGPEITGEITVGSTDFTESLLLAEMYAQVIESGGAEVRRFMRFGSREEVLPALESGDLDLVPEYVSSVLRHYDPEVIPPLALEDVLAAARDAVDSNLELLEPAPAQDTPGFVVSSETAERLGLTQVGDLAHLPERLILGGPQDCPISITCIAGLEEVYRVPVDVE